MVDEDRSNSWRRRRERTAMLVSALVTGIAVNAIAFAVAFAQEPPPPAAQPATTTSAPGSEERPGFLWRFFDAYYEQFFPPEKPTPAPATTEPEPLRRAMPSPWSSPPFPGSEYQGYPLIGVPYSAPASPLMKALEGTALGDWLKENRIYTYGWINASANISSSKNSNSPDSYWLVPNTALLDQLIFRIERPTDNVQTDHIDWGFRSTFMYGSDYRYTTAGGWFSDQLLEHNQLYGFDPTEQYVDIYFPRIFEGTEFRIGRWIATPDIETQFAPDNYLGSHSLLFTFDTYTQTGFMVSHRLTKQWMVQWGVHAGTDMAPWYKGAVPTGYLGVRWVAEDNNDSIYLVLNSINDAKFQKFKEDGKPAGHDNYNYLVGTWSHRFTPQLFTATESYFMWQRDAVVGGTPSIGPVQSFGGGGGIGADLPGISYTYGVLNYTMWAVTGRNYFTLRNEWWRDERGMRSGFATNYSSHTLGFSYGVNDVMWIRPEVGYFHSYDTNAFDLGKKDYQWQAGVDVILRF